MKKRILCGIVLILLCAVLFSPVSVFAAPPDYTTGTSLALCYSKDGTAFVDYSVSIYRVAALYENGSYYLEPPFSEYPVNIYGVKTQKEWQDIADTLSACVVAEGVESYETQWTDENGEVHFVDLETGLYLVEAVVAENDAGTYLFDRFMVYLPTPLRDGTYTYDVEARPKCVEFVPKTEYSVTKLWRDDTPADRPDEIGVSIYKDGEQQETVLLNSDNGWTYSWRISADADGIWAVMEEDIPDGYEMTVSQNGASFFITNTAEAPDLSVTPDDTPDDDDIPDTDDHTVFLLWITLLLISGGTLLCLNRRRG